MAEVARQLRLDARQLYLRRTPRPGCWGDRWKSYEKRRAEASLAKARSYVEAACRSLRQEGRALSMREIQARVRREVLGTVEHLFDLLKDIKLESGS